MTVPPLILKRWKRLEYDRLVDVGLFRSDPVELIAGQLVVAEPQGSYHATAVGAADDALRAVLPAGWIVNLIDRVLEVYRDPRPDPSAPYGWRYGSVQTLTPSAVVVPLALPSAQLAVADLLP